LRSRPRLASERHDRGVGDMMRARADAHDLQPVT
jgi:hypothetical protein